MALLADEIVVVTGSTSGLGKVIAARCAAEGAAVIVSGRSADRGKEVVSRIVTDGGRAHFIRTDLEAPSGPEELIESVLETYGPPTVLINNANVSNQHGELQVTVEESSAEVWDTVLTVNLLAPARLISACVGPMREAGGGSIVNVSSRVASHGTPRSAAYSAAKGGLEALTRNVAVDYAEYGIRCNAVRPGYILHEVRDAEATEEQLASIAASQLSRPVEARDVAAACVWLASPETETITGLVLPVDGGSTAGRPEVISRP